MPATPSNAIDVTTTGAVSFNGTAFTGGTLSVSNGGTGAATLTGVLTGNGTSAITGGSISASSVNGITSGSAPAAGTIGEYISSFKDSSHTVNLSNGVTADITSITLSAGVWNISAHFVLNTGSTVTTVQGGVSTTSATLPANGTIGDASFYVNGGITSTGTMDFYVVDYRVSINGSTTYYMVINHAFSAGTASAYGRISGTRVG